VNEFAANNLGPEGEFLFDVATFNQSMFNQLAASSGYAAADILRGSNPFVLVTSPVAGAIRAARERHIGNAQPLPDDVKSALAMTFHPQTLARARYTVGTVEITLPNFINSGSTLFEDDVDAVVVDDVIVFREPPGDYLANTYLWAHELTHVDQYRRLGVEEFAFQYVRDGGHSLEREATRNGNAASSGVFNNSSYGISLAMGQIGVNAPLVTDANGEELPEIYVAQCFFPTDPNPVLYLVTNTSKIVAVHAITGEAIQIGWASESEVFGALWTYETPDVKYAVDGFGRIATFNFFGQPTVIGQVVPL
jgi:hypothetical protein